MTSKRRDDLTSIALRIHQNVDERIVELRALASKEGTLAAAPFHEKYQASRRILSRSLETRSNASEMVDALFEFIKAAEVYVNATWLGNSDEAKKIRIGTLKMANGYSKYLTSLVIEQGRPEALRNEFNLLKGSLDSQHREISAIEARLSEISKELNTAYGPLQRKYDEIQLRFISDIQHIDQKKKEINGLTAVVTDKAITSSYTKGSIYERKAADDLRSAALGVMALVCILAGISFVYAFDKEFHIVPTLFRLSFIIILSVPAAYLARESAKHRKQQYEYLQTALDVQAITPYIASLPTEIQHKLKEEMATRIFTTKSFDHVTKESYPINLQEIIVAAFNAARSEDQKKGKEVEKSKENKETKDNKENS
ncbi:hypothetical protein [Massilia sp. TN1-12]|uniref:hypothetical protein n=1 Tax=Massilia paldalensis TaxID=3377675 RepID=UPI003850DE54